MSIPGYGDNPHNGGENNGEQPGAQSGQPYGGAPYNPNQYPQQDGQQGGQQFAGFNSNEVKKTGKGFFGALFDTSFDNMIALKFARFIYTLALIFAAATLFFGWVIPFFTLLFSPANGSTFLAFAVLLFGWIPIGLVALFQLIGIRLFLEFVVSTIKTAENTSKLVAQR
ncbi:DUF4282 domain-containing protein [Corynebacterium sp. A21]|uniref:DUF4282 domain-containing protein n=1 Tax=Corynebacterium sp. A21 TaxID=3457318 RepID=UPI003FD6609A